MKEIITVQIIRPNLDLLDDDSRQRYIEDMAKDIIAQILMQENTRRLNEQMAYWDTMFGVWEFDYRIKKMKDAENFK